MIGRTEKWFAVINPHGHVSSAFSYVDFAKQDLAKREDREACRIAEIEVKVTAWVEQRTNKGLSTRLSTRNCKKS